METELSFLLILLAQLGVGLVLFVLAVLQQP
jgi:hypothetical protein